MQTEANILYSAWPTSGPGVAFDPSRSVGTNYSALGAVRSFPQSAPKGGSIGLLESLINLPNAVGKKAPEYSRNGKVSLF